jgi:hypothetical protein
MKKLIPLLMLFIALPSWAGRQFDIEVIIFKRVVNAEKTDESWPNMLAPIQYNNSGYLFSQAYLSSKGARLLPAKSFQLNAQERQLKQHAGFRVLLHTAWRQGDQGKFSSPVFHIRAGKDYSNLFNPDGSERSTSSPAPVTGGTEESVPKPLYELDGKLQVYVQHYLYVDAMFDLKKPSVRDVSVHENPVNLSQDTDENGNNTNMNHGDDSNSNVQLGHLQAISSTVTEQKFLKSYRMDQKRRMRSGETLYFDHPLMGMILQVRKVPAS